MKPHSALFLMLAACAGNVSTRPSSDSITQALHRGMTETEVVEASSNRSPNRVIMRTCGTETPTPFSCKVFVYDTAQEAGAGGSTLWVVFEEVDGQWRVKQLL